MSELDQEPSPLTPLKLALQKDLDYAWTWHCNLAMAFYDSWNNETRPADIHRKANEAAARFMKQAFDVDVKQCKQYQDIAADSKDIPETVAMVPVATYDGVEFTRYTLCWLNGAMPEGTTLYAPESEVWAKRLTTAQMLASIPTAEEVEAANAVPAIEEAAVPMEEIQPEGDHALARPGTEGREHA